MILAPNTPIKTLWKVILILLLSLALTQPAGARTRSGYIYHKVKKGETLYRIAKRYGVSLKEIMRVNRIKDPKRVRVGRVLAIPKKRKSSYKGSSIRGAKTQKKRGHSTRTKKGEFILPGRVLLMNPGTNHGLDLKLAGGIVRAAGDGKVAYCASAISMVGYSSLLIIQHEGGFETVYAGSNVEWTKKKGEWVMQGEIIGITKNGYPLHFEIRRKGQPVSALRYLKR